MVSVLVNFNKEAAAAFGEKEHMRIEVRDGRVVMRPTKRTKVRTGSDSVMSTIYYKGTGGAMLRLNNAKLDKLAEHGATGLKPGNRYSLEPLTYTWFALVPVDPDKRLMASLSKA